MGTFDFVSRPTSGPVRQQLERQLADAASPVAKRLGSVGPNDDTRLLVIVGHPWAGANLTRLVVSTAPEVWPVGTDHEHHDIACPDDLRRRAHLRSLRAGPQRTSPQWIVTSTVSTELAPELASDERVQVVLMVRRPEETLPRLQQTGGLVEVAALRRYRTDLERICRTARNVGESDRLFIITYDDLTRRREATLDGLSRSLGLSQQLSGRYTAPKRSKNPSAMFRIGRLALPEPRTRPPLDERVGRAADAVYREALDELRARRRGWLVEEQRV